MSFAPATAAAVQDGSFETQGANAGSGYCYLNGGGCGGIGGTWFGGAGFEGGGGAGFVNEGNGDWPGIATDGTYHAFVQGGGFLAQFLDIPTSGNYTLSWAEAGRTRGGYDAPHNYAVRIVGDGAVFAEYLGTSTSTGAFVSRSLSVSDLVAGGAYALVFVGDGSGGDRTTFIDQVSLQAVGNVPEPAQWAMMIGGFGVLGATARRRRTTALA